MGLFSKKGTCAVCGSSKGEAVADGFICKQCFVKGGLFGASLAVHKKLARVADVQKAIDKNVAYKESQAEREKTLAVEKERTAARQQESDYMKRAALEKAEYMAEAQKTQQTLVEEWKLQTRQAQRALDEGFRYFDWNVDSDDAGHAKTRDDVYNNVTSKIKPGRENVVLMHDFSHNNKTLDALSDIIDFGLNNGYVFRRITYDTKMVTHSVNN